MSQQQRKLLSSSKSEYVSVLRLCMTPTEVTKKKRILATSTATEAAAPYYFLASLRSQEGQMKESSDCSWPVLTKFLGKAHETLALWTRCSRAYLLTLSWITKSNLDMKIDEVHKFQFHFSLDWISITSPHRVFWPKIYFTPLVSWLGGQVGQK